MIELTQKVNNKATILNLFLGHERWREERLELLLLYRNVVIWWRTSLSSSCVCLLLGISCCWCILEMALQSRNRNGRQFVIDLLDSIAKGVVLFVVELVVSRQAKCSIKAYLFILFIDIV